MFRSIRTHLNPASLLAMVALFVALGGISYAAATIDGKNIENGTVTGKKLKKGTITGAKVKADSIGGPKIKESTLGQVPSAAKATTADSATSATSAQSAQSAVTAQSAASAASAETVGPNGVGTAALQDDAVTGSKLGNVAFRVGESVSVPNNASRRVDASCEPGEVMLSGGAIWAGVSDADNSSQLHTVHSYPSTSGSWGVRGYNGTGAPVTLTARALCLTN